MTLIYGAIWAMKVAVVVGLLGSIWMLWDVSKRTNLIPFAKSLLKFSLLVGVPSAIIAAGGLWVFGNFIFPLFAYKLIVGIITACAFSAAFVSLSSLPVALLGLMFGIWNKKFPSGVRS